MPRLMFEKTGKAIWISHLDLMRVFQRAFKRAGLPLKHTQGFNPRPSVSIALPLSVGVESKCELLDFDLEIADITLCDIRDRLNEMLPVGVCVSDVYENGRKIRDLKLLSCRLSLEYDNGIPANTTSAIEELFSRESLLVSKKTKSGILDQDVIPMIRRLEVSEAGEKDVQINALICCQNPTLNPAQLIAAISGYIPEYAPNFCRYKRIEIYDEQEGIFR